MKSLIAKLITAQILICASCYVTPSFAQSNNTAMARMFDELQNLKQEVEELRNMLEEQRYQIEQLKREKAALSQDAQLPSDIQVDSEQLNSEQIQVVQAPSESGVQERVEAVTSTNTGQPNVVQDNSLQRFPKESSQNTENTAQELPKTDNEAIASPSALLGAVVVEERQIVVAPVKEVSKNSTPVEERAVLVDSDRVEQVITKVPAIDAAKQPEKQPANVGVNADSTVIQTEVINQERIEPPIEGNTPIVAIPPISPSPIVVNNTAVASGAVANTAVSPSDIKQSDANVLKSQASGKENVASAPANTKPVKKAVTTQKSEAERDLYQQGFNFLKESKYQDGIRVFQRQITLFPKGDLVDDASYWVAESHYINGDLDEAKTYFKSIVKNYPDSMRVPDALLKTAYIEQEQGNQVAAQEILNRIVQFHPRSNAAIAAKNRLKIL